MVSPRLQPSFQEHRWRADLLLRTMGYSILFLFSYKSSSQCHDTWHQKQNTRGMEWCTFEFQLKTTITNARQNTWRLSRLSIIWSCHRRKHWTLILGAVRITITIFSVQLQNSSLDYCHFRWAKVLKCLILTSYYLSTEMICLKRLLETNTPWRMFTTQEILRSSWR